MEESKHLFFILLSLCSSGTITESVHNTEVCLVGYLYFSQMSLQFPNECTFLQCQHILKEITHCGIEILEIICSLKHNFRKDYNTSTMNKSISDASRKAVQDCLAQWLAFTERDYDTASQFIRLWKKTLVWCRGVGAAGP